MTVEVSALIPIVLMVLWLFFSYLFYFMNCGITQGIMEEALQKAADIRITGADYDTGKISYAKLPRTASTASAILSFLLLHQSHPSAWRTVTLFPNTSFNP